MTLTWKDLPLETLRSILDRLPPEVSLYTTVQCARVCKSWKAVVDYQLYSKVKIDSVKKLKDFNKSISESNSSAALLVKSVDLSIKTFLHEDDKYQVYVLVSNLLNLQHFECVNLECHEQVMDAVMDGKLLNLRTLGSDLTLMYSNDYITCALHLKNRLRNIFLDCTTRIGRRLLDRLHQFANLETIYFEVMTMDLIEGLESIAGKCATLKHVNGHFVRDTFSERSAPPVEEGALVSLYTPSVNVDILEIHDQGTLKASHILYIMHKYPALNTLRITGNCILSDRTSVERFMTYLLNRKYIRIDRITTDIESVCDSIGRYWKAMRERYLMQLERIMFQWDKELSLKLSNDGNSQRITTVRGALSVHKLDKVVEKYGIYMGAVQICSFKNKAQGRSETHAMGKFLSTMVECCVKMQTLIFSKCEINYGKDFRTVKLIRIRQFSLRNLCCYECDVGVNLLYSLFAGVRYIGHLNFSDCKFWGTDNTLTCWIEMHFQATRIKNVSIIRPKNFQRDTRYLFLSLWVTDKKNPRHGQAHYVYDFGTVTNRVFKPTTKENFYDKTYTENYHFYLVCKSIESLEVEYKQMRILLPSS